MELFLNLALFFVIVIGSITFAGWSGCVAGKNLIKIRSFSVRRAELLCLAIYASGCAVLIGLPAGGKFAAFGALYLIAFSIVLLFATSAPMRISEAVRR